MTIKKRKQRQLDAKNDNEEEAPKPTKSAKRRDTAAPNYNTLPTTTTKCQRQRNANDNNDNKALKPTESSTRRDTAVAVDNTVMLTKRRRQ